MGGMQHNGVDNKVSPEIPRALVNALKDKKHVIGYYVWDEPYNDEQFTEARRQMDMLEELAPDALLLTHPLYFVSLLTMYEKSIAKQQTKWYT